MSEWQPIETAPKTTQARLIWCPDNQSTFCVTWQEADKLDPDRHPYSEGWIIFGSGEWRHYLQTATHWMPLPDPPK